jgi:hypothetical protein
MFFDIAIAKQYHSRGENRMIQRQPKDKCSQRKKERKVRSSWDVAHLAVECLPSVRQVIGSISSTEKK